MSITISKKHGVNPSVTVCPLCGKETGLALFGRLGNDEKAPRTVMDDSPCDECTQHMKMGILFLEREGDCLTGRRWVLKQEAVERMIEAHKGTQTAPMLQKILESRAGYIGSDVAKYWGFYDEP